MDYAILFNWTSSFVILGMFGVFFYFYFVLKNNPVSKQCRSYQTPRSALFA